MTTIDVLVVGGGIAGLTVAHTIRATDPTVGVIVLEAATRAGGKLTTEVRDGYTFDRGPSQFSRRARPTMRLIEELGLAGRVTAAGPAARQVSLVRGDRVVPVPTTPLAAVTTRLLSPAAKLRILAEPVLAGRQPGEETIYAFAARHFGRAFAEAVVAPAALGATAADIRDTSLDAAFPRLRQMEAAAGRTGLLGAALGAARRQPRGAGSPLASFSPGGLGVLTEALTAALGDAVRNGERATSLCADGRDRFTVTTASGHVYHAQAVVVAVPGYAAGELLAAISPGAAEAARGIPFVGVRVFGLGYRVADLPAPVPGSGILATHRPDRHVFGIAPVSNVFPQHAPPGHQLLRIFTGGQHDPAMVSLPRARALELVQADLRTLLGLRATPCFVADACWTQGIPRYRLGHRAQVAVVEQALARHPGLFVAGNWLHGAGLDATIGHAYETARHVLQQPTPASLGESRP